MNGFSHGSISISPIYIQYTAYAHTIALDLFEENGVRQRSFCSHGALVAIVVQYVVRIGDELCLASKLGLDRP